MRVYTIPNFQKCVWIAKIDCKVCLDRKKSCVWIANMCLDRKKRGAPKTL